MRARTLRLAVLSYLALVLSLDVARLLALVRFVTLPSGFEAIDAQADGVQGTLLIMNLLGVLVMMDLNRRRRLDRLTEKESYANPNS